MLGRTRAFVRGLRDGWAQPLDLGSSRNLDDLLPRQRVSGVYSWGHRRSSVLNWGDRGINLGQIARAGRRSEAWRERYWPRRSR